MVLVVHEDLVSCCIEKGRFHEQLFLLIPLLLLVRLLDKQCVYFTQKLASLYPLSTQYLRCATSILPNLTWIRKCIAYSAKLSVIARNIKIRQKKVQAERYEYIFLKALNIKLRNKLAKHFHASIFFSSKKNRKKKR